MSILRTQDKSFWKCPHRYLRKIGNSCHRPHSRFTKRGRAHYIIPNESWFLCNTSFYVTHLKVPIVSKLFTRATKICPAKTPCTQTCYDFKDVPVMLEAGPMSDLAWGIRRSRALHFSCSVYPSSLLRNGRPSPSVCHGARVGSGLVEAPAAQDERPPLLPELGAEDRVDDDVDRRVDH